MRGIVCRIKENCNKREIIRSVTFFDNLEELAQICQQISKGQAAIKGPNIRLVCVHWENSEHTTGHIHILHDCNTNHGSCRCAFLKGFGKPVFHAKGTIYSRQFEEADVYRVLLYFSSGERQAIYIFIGDGRAAIPSETALLQASGLVRVTRTGTTEESIRGHNVPLRSYESLPCHPSEDVRGIGRRGSGSRWYSLGEKNLSYEEKMYNFIVKYYHMPVDAILHSEVWLNSPFRFVRSNNPVFQTVADSICSEWVHKSVSDITYFWQGKSFIFWEDEKWCKVNGRRYDVHTSVLYAEQLLLFQLGSEDDLC